MNTIKWKLTSEVQPEPARRWRSGRQLSRKRN